MGDYSIPKGQPRRRPGSVWWRCEQMGHDGGPAQPSGGGWYSNYGYLVGNMSNVHNGYLGHTRICHLSGVIRAEHHKASITIDDSCNCWQMLMQRTAASSAGESAESDSSEDLLVRPPSAAFSCSSSGPVKREEIEDVIEVLFGTGGIPPDDQLLHPSFNFRPFFFLHSCKYI